MLIFIILSYKLTTDLHLCSLPARPSRCPACVAAVPFPFPGEEFEQASGRAKECARVSEKGNGVGKKGIACSHSQTFHGTSFSHEREAIVQFDWLEAFPSLASPLLSAPCFSHSLAVSFPSRDFLETSATQLFTSFRPYLRKS